MSLVSLVNGGLLYLAAALAVLAYVAMAVRRLASLRHADATPADFADLLYPGTQDTVGATFASAGWQLRLALVLGLVGIVAVFFAPLALAWSRGYVQTPYVAVGGLLPWSDASGWLHGLYYLMNTGELTDWTVRRPVHLAYLATLTWITGNGLTGILALRTLMLAAACALLARELQRSLGWTAALVALAMLAGFAATYSPTTLSEASGLTFGAAAMALLWRGATQRRLGHYALGATLMALGLSVRTGPVLVLGAIAAWPLLCSAMSARQRLYWSAVSGLAMVAAVGLAWLWVAALYSGDNVPGANFSFTLYGLAHGGLPWYVFYEHYDATELSQGAQAALAYQAAFAQIRSDPALLMQGLWSFFGNYLTYAFHYVPYGFRSQVTWLFVIGLGVALWRWREPQARLLLLLAAGSVATAPIIFWALDAYRAFIVAAPIEATVVAAAASLLVRTATGGERPFSGPRIHPARGRLLPAFGMLLVACTSVLPAIALTTAKERTVVTATCPDHQTPFAVELGGDSPYLEIVEPHSPATPGKQIRLPDFRANVKLGDTAIAGQLMELQPGHVVAHGNDLVRHRSVAMWLIFEPGQIDADGIYQGCARKETITRGKHTFELFYASTAARHNAPP